MVVTTESGPRCEAVCGSQGIRPHRGHETKPLSTYVIAGHSYAVQYRDELTTGPWLNLADLPVQPASGLANIGDTNTMSATRFYRVVTPGQ